MRLSEIGSHQIDDPKISSQKNLGLDKASHELHINKFCTAKKNDKKTFETNLKDFESDSISSLSVDEKTDDQEKIDYSEQIFAQMFFSSEVFIKIPESTDLTTPSPTLENEQKLTLDLENVKVNADFILETEPTKNQNIGITEKTNLIVSDNIVNSLLPRTVAKLANSTAIKEESFDSTLFKSEEQLQIEPETYLASENESNNINTPIKAKNIEEIKEVSILQPDKFDELNEKKSSSSADSVSNTAAKLINDVPITKFVNQSNIEQLKVDQLNFEHTNFENVDLIRQIIKEVQVDFTSTISEMKLKLRPESLGDVSLKVITENGLITAQFVAENQRVKEIIESNFYLLRDALQDSGVSVSQLSVSVGQDKSDNQQGDNKKNNMWFSSEQRKLAAVSLEVPREAERVFYVIKVSYSA